MNNEGNVLKALIEPRNGSEVEEASRNSRKISLLDDQQ
jgi:hypothetical protein